MKIEELKKVADRLRGELAWADLEIINSHLPALIAVAEAAKKATEEHHPTWRTLAVAKLNAALRALEAVK